MNGLLFGCWSLFTGEMISCCLRISKCLFSLACNCKGTLARCFLKIASVLNGRCNVECSFSISNFALAYTFGHFSVMFASC